MSDPSLASARDSEPSAAKETTPHPYAEPVILVGWFDEKRAPGPVCGSLTLATRHDNGVDLDNEEQDVPIRICREPVRSWSQLRPERRHLD